MPEEVSTEKKKSPVMALAKAAVGIGAIVGVECAVAAMILPSSTEIEAVGQEMAAARLDQEVDTPESVETIAPREDIREVSLGDFHITSFQPATGTTLQISLSLYGTVLESDVAEYERLFQIHEHRLKEQVTSTMRTAEITDLVDEGLGLVRRRILDKSNRTLGKPLLQSMVFSDFSFFEH